jgi:hypothetical protein
MTLRPGDVLEYVVTASDPLEEPLQCQFGFSIGSVGGFFEKWLNENTFTFEVADDYVGQLFIASIRIKSPREYHASASCDDNVNFTYEVLPPK